MELKEEITRYLDFCKYRKELDDKTIKAYRIDLKQYVNYVECDNPNKSQIEDYVTALHKKYKQKTIKRKIASLKAFYNYLEDELIIPDNPFRKIKLKFKETMVLPRIIPRNEIEQLLRFLYSSKEQPNYFRDISVVEVLFATGMRVYEISNIQEDCIDLASGLIKIMGKGGKERYVQIASNSILSILRKYYEIHKKQIKESGYFFVNRNGSRLTEQSIRLMIKKYTKLAGIRRNITPHMFRHSFATYLIEEGVDISCVQQILGHSSIRTTQIYIHIAACFCDAILRDKHPRNKMHIPDAA